MWWIWQNHLFKNKSNNVIDENFIKVWLFYITFIFINYCEEIDSRKKIDLSKIPTNYKVLFAFGKYLCKCHNSHLSYANILMHNEVNDITFHLNMFGEKKITKKKKSNIKKRRENKRLVEKMIDKTK